MLPQRNRQENSNTAQRIEVMRKLLQLMKASSIKVILMDREFTSKEALKLYWKRWSIELLFSHLKKKGFNLEDTHIINGRKIEKTCL